MANDFLESTNVWVVDSAAALITDAPHFTKACVDRVVFVPSAADDDLVLQDAASASAIVLKAGATDASPVTITFPNGGKWINGLKCSTIDGGTAYVYLR